MSFPQEPLDLPASEGEGHYPAGIHQKLNSGKFEIVRKLGYGPRSSTWLAYTWDEEEKERYFAIKIYTVAASEHAKTVKVPIFKGVHCFIPASRALPPPRGTFWENTGAGSHLCLVLNPLSTNA